MNTALADDRVPIIEPRESSIVPWLTLVLNQNYEVLSTAKVIRVLVMLENGRAEIIEQSELPIVTSSGPLPRPSVVRLVNLVRRPRPRVRFTRHNVFRRDGHTCLYCGKRPRDLTIDHVVPVSRGGKDTWVNSATSCSPCNRKKGARTPEEARMPLRHPPYEPKLDSYMHVVNARPEWAPYLPD